MSFSKPEIPICDLNSALDSPVLKRNTRRRGQVASSFFFTRCGDVLVWLHTYHSFNDSVYTAPQQREMHGITANEDYL